MIEIHVPNIDGIEMLKVCWSHDGVAADLVRMLKYKRKTSVVTAIADEMANITQPVAAPALLTWIPCTPKRRKERGFDPSELLARALARRLKLKAAPTLRRIDGQPQTSRNRQGRLVGPELQLRRKQIRIPYKVILVDDVCTTGSTLRVAASVLRLAGAETIIAVVATAASPN